MRKKLQVPPQLVEKIQTRRCNLFLGSGASIGAKGKYGNLPVGQGLAEILAEKFLSKRYAKESLTLVAEMVAGKTGTKDLEEFLVDFFENATPTRAHLLIPKYPWRAIFTTNYDDLIERSYEAVGRSDFLHISVSDASMGKDIPELPGHLELLKLHGCIRHSPSIDNNLVLTVPQYARVEKNRKVLFQRFEDIAGSFSTLFIGHRLQDQDVERYLAEDPDKRNHGFLVLPKLDSEAVSYLTKKNVTGIPATFHDFMEALERDISTQKVLAGQFSFSDSHAIEKKIAVRDPLDIALVAHLDQSYKYIDREATFPAGDPKLFFTGQLNPFSAIVAGCAVKRSNFGDAMVQLMIDGDQVKPGKIKTTLVTGPAGSGKTVYLANLAYQLGAFEDKVVLHHSLGHPLKADVIAAVASKLSEALYLFIDNGSDWIDEIEALFSAVGKTNGRVVLVVAERTNESGYRGLARSLRDPRPITVAALSNGEARSLVAVLTENNCLGQLAKLPIGEQIKSLTNPSGANRDLLVGIYGATLNRSLEEHLVNEYEDIPDELAKQIYLTICCVHRLKVNVRAGAIMRIHGVNFEDFSRDFLTPLQEVVVVERESNGDIFYRSRHQVIAQIVYERVLADEEERLHVMLKALKALLTGYSTDEPALRGLIKHDSLVKNFPTPSIARRFIDGFLDSIGDDAFAVHQAAVYELRANLSGDLERARILLDSASEIAPDDQKIKHSVAYLKYRESQLSSNESKSQYLMKESEALCKALLHGSSPYPYHTLALIYMSRLRAELFGNGINNPGVIESYHETAQVNISSGLAIFPEEPLLMEAHAELQKLIGESNRAEKILRDILKTNPGRAGAAIALSRICREAGSFGEAQEILEIACHKSEKNGLLKLELAEFLANSPADFSIDYDRIETLVRSAEVQNRLPLRAKLLRIRALYGIGKKTEARKLLRSLSSKERNSGIDWCLFKSKERLKGTVSHSDPFIGITISTEHYGSVLGRVGRFINSSENIPLPGSAVSFHIALSSAGLVAMDIKSEYI